MAAVVLVPYRGESVDPLSSRGRDPAVDVGGRIVLAIGGLAGLTWLGAGIGEILGA
jgi:hypothetical protein